MSSSAPERRSTRNKGKPQPNYNDRDLTVVNQDGSRTVHQITVSVVDQFLSSQTEQNIKKQIQSDKEALQKAAMEIISQEDNSDEAVLSRMEKSFNSTVNLATVEMKYDYTYYNESKSDSVEDDLDLDRS